LPAQEDALSKLTTPAGHLTAAAPAAWKAVIACLQIFATHRPLVVMAKRLLKKLVVVTAGCRMVRAGSTRQHDATVLIIAPVLLRKTR